MFFDFENSETCHFANWLLCTDEVDVDFLVREACRPGQQDRWSNANMGPLSTGWFRLEEKLSALLHQKLAKWSKLDVGEDGISLPPPAEEAQAAYAGTDGLFKPLICEAVCRIDSSNVALALLIRAGRWTLGHNEPMVS